MVEVLTCICMQPPRQRRGAAWQELIHNRRQIEQKLLWQRLFKLHATCMPSRHVADFIHAIGIKVVQIA